MNYARTKIPFLYSGYELKIFKYLPFEQTLCIDTYRINFVYLKMEFQGNIAYLWKKKIILIFKQLYNFVRKTTSESRSCCNVNVRSENGRQKHDFVTALIFGCRNDVGNTTFDNVVTVLSDVEAKTQPKPNVVTTLCASWDLFSFLNYILFLMKGNMLRENACF